MELEDVDLFLEVGQVYNSESSGRLFAHADKEFAGERSILRELRDLGVERASGDALPPASAQSFLKELGRSAPAVVISDFDDQYTNP